MIEAKNLYMKTLRDAQKSNAAHATATPGVSAPERAAHQKQQQARMTGKHSAVID